MSDLINRRDAIDAVDIDGLNRGIVDALQNIISDPQIIPAVDVFPPAQQWTPASNPPKESGYYLVTVRRLYGIGELVIIKWFDSELNLWSMDNLYIPTAWMPLPEPYKEEN